MASGQFPTRVKINFAGAPEDAPTLNTNFVQGQFHGGSRKLSQQLLTGNILQNQEKLFSPLTQKTQSFSNSFSGFENSPSTVEFFGNSHLSNLRFRRDATKSKISQKRQVASLTDGAILDDSFFDTTWFDGLAQFGDKGLKQSLTKRHSIEDEVTEHDKEPAEGEVKAVRSFCNHCLIEPFQSALVLAWKNASPGPKVLKAKASTTCGDF